MITKAHQVSKCPYCGSGNIEFEGNDLIAARHKKKRTVWKCRTDGCGKSFTSDTVARAEREKRLLD
jgi:transposase-like protein